MPAVYATRWTLDFQTLNSDETLPLPVKAEHAVVTDCAYYNRSSVDSRPQHCVIVYTLAGLGCLTSRGRAQTCSPGSALVFINSEPELEWYYPETADNDWEFIWVAFAGRTAVDLGRKIIARYGRKYHSDQCFAVMRRLAGLHKSAGEIVQVQAFEGAGLVFDAFRELEAAAREEKRRSAPPLVRMAKQYVRNADCRTLSVARTAAALNVSREHLSRCFRKQEGIPLQDYIIDTKMQTACRLLKGTPLSVKETAAATGFSNSTAFIRAFKERLMMTPMQYRTNIMADG